MSISARFSSRKVLPAALAGALTAGLVVGAAAVAAPGGSPGKPAPDPTSTSLSADISIDGVGTSPLPLLSFNSGVSSSIGSATGGAGAGKASFQDFHFTKLVDGTSPTLFLAVATGKHFTKATVKVKKAGATEPFMIYTLHDVLVTSYQSGGSSGDALPVDQISINFRKIEIEVDGTRAGFDVAAEKSI